MHINQYSPSVELHKVLTPLCPIQYVNGRDRIQEPQWPRLLDWEASVTLSLTPVLLVILSVTPSVPPWITLTLSDTSHCHSLSTCQSFCQSLCHSITCQSLYYPINPSHLHVSFSPDNWFSAGTCLRNCLTSWFSGTRTQVCSIEKILVFFCLMVGDQIRCLLLKLQTCFRWNSLLAQTFSQILEIQNPIERLNPCKPCDYRTLWMLFDDI